MYVSPKCRIGHSKYPCLLSFHSAIITLSPKSHTLTKRNITFHNADDSDDDNNDNADADDDDDDNKIWLAPLSNAPVT